MEEFTNIEKPWQRWERLLVFNLVDITLILTLAGPRVEVLLFFEEVESSSPATRHVLLKSTFSTLTCISGALFLFYASKIFQRLKIILVFLMEQQIRRKNPAPKCGIFAYIFFVNDSWSE